MNEMNPQITRLYSKGILREAATFQRCYATIVKHVGKYVLLHKDSVVNYFNSYREATAEGFRRFDFDNFLVKRVRKPPNSTHAKRRVAGRKSCHAILRSTKHE